MRSMIRRILLFLLLSLLMRDGVLHFRRNMRNVRNVRYEECEECEEYEKGIRGM